MPIKLYSFDLPFVKPLVTAKGTFDSRKGLLIEVQHGGHTFWGEVSPLPGFSDSTLENCQNWFILNGSSFYSEFLKRYNSIEKKNSIGTIIHVISSLGFPNLPPKTPPEILFALDSLLFQAVSQNSNLQLQPRFILEVNSAASDLSTALTQIQSGFKTVKLKVGIDWPREVNSILTLRSKYPDVAIRLDANESWTVTEAHYRLQELEHLKIDYIEQPVNVSDLTEYGADLKDYGIKIAADESARTVQMIRELIRVEAADVFILKPSMIGGFKSVFEACNEIKSAGNRVVFTSSLDSSLNVSITTLLAKHLAHPDEVHGLSTGTLFLEDLNPNKVTIKDSMLEIDTNWIINPELTLNKSLIIPLS